MSRYPSEEVARFDQQFSETVSERNERLAANRKREAARLTAATAEAPRKPTTPTKPGFYWAKWRIADDGTPEGDEQTPSDVWEVMHVFENCNDTDDPEYLRVEVPGQARSQSIENFFWGPKVEPPR